MKIEDLTGRVFGKLKVMERDYGKILGKTEYYRCECKCGNKNYITTAKELLAGKGSCGCLKKKKGFNDYKIDGYTTIIYFTNNLDEIIMQGYIDTEDLMMLIELDYRWCLMWNEHSKNWYAKTSEYYKDEYGKTKIRRYYLHRKIMYVTDKHLVVDHIDHENFGTLNNRKYNLRVATDLQNSDNRKSKNSNNKSGYRNVWWSTREEKWFVTLQIKGRQKKLGKFKYDELEEAGISAEEMRQKYYGEFAGKN